MTPPDLSLARALYRLKEQGGAWLIRRLRHEWVAPSTGLGKGVFRARLKVLACLRKIRPPTGGPSVGDSHLLYAFYDLAVAPVTFDLLWLIVGAEVRRRRLGLEGVHFVVVPGQNNGLREESAEYESAVDVADRHLRLFNIVLPAFSLLPATRGISLLTSRAEAELLRNRALHVFPEDYEVGAPRFPHPGELQAQAKAGACCQVLEAPAGARRTIRQWMAHAASGRRIVTITLRHYEFGTARNSDIVVWAAFARSLDPQLWKVVFLADTARAFDPVPPELQDFEFLHGVSLNLPLRMAFYQEAWINLGVNSGPMLLTCFSPARGIMFRMITEDVPQTSSAYMCALGFELGQQPAIAHPFHKWVWEREDVVVIRREFDDMVAELEALD
jgi:hypothetical protein